MGARRDHNSAACASIAAGTLGGSLQGGRAAGHLSPTRACEGRVPLAATACVRVLCLASAARSAYVQTPIKLRERAEAPLAAVIYMRTVPRHAHFQSGHV
jgi:hypothetical protein